MDALVTMAGVVVVVVAVQLWMLHRWIDGLRDKEHAEAGKKAAELVGGIQAYHDKLAADLRGKAVDAERRAQVLERRVTEAGAVLEAASNLVKRLRELVDELSSRPAQVAAGLGPRPVSSVRPHAPPRKTLLGIRPPPPPEEGDRVTEEELTRVLERPQVEKGGGM